MVTSTARWTIDELGAQVALALAVDYNGPPNSRVREVPDRRTIRYYTTLGLIDRPAEIRGRTALYSQRHLCQLVAIKRLQAQGLALAEIQERLVGLTDAALRRLAKLPDRDPPVSAAASTETGADRRTQAFWAAAPAPMPDRLEFNEAPGPDPIAVVLGLAGVNPQETATTQSHPLQALPLDAEVLLVLAQARSLDEDDREAIRVAAAPLLKLLEARRLLRPRQERGTS
jgi:DNA-binding transcriptional MerR regulator